ncbi:MAG: succinate dehydrogenase/fumarate reductase iron-sulfur subunit [Deltaproteobacteria bacterium]|nr:succinate dehydrogenase/fumarate reductase iron-sulfur subunit [Deltaproteobacteria bacterium]
MKNKYNITLKIDRYDPDNKRSWVQTYELEAGRILRFTDVFREINNEIDPSLAWNSSCEHAQCGTCAVRVNGKPLLACELLVENAVAHFGTTVFEVAPITVAPVIRDLVVDFEQAYERVSKVKPYIIEPAQNPNSGNEYQIDPRDLDRYVDATRCVNCFCCADACISSEKGFLGPNAVMASIVRLMDPRENSKDERLELLYSEEGVYRCHTSMACSFVCPKEIDVAVPQGDRCGTFHCAGKSRQVQIGTEEITDG